MEFKINGKDVKLKFGVKFVRLLDEKYKVDYQGFEFGTGLLNVASGLEQMSVVTLADIIDAATKDEYPEDIIDEAIEDYAEKEGGLKKLFKQIKDELGKSQVVKDTMTNIEKNAKKAETEDQTNPLKLTRK